mgnify:CR=1 FL=1
MPEPARDSWIAAFDGLRACAALAVFGVHFQQIAQFSPGNIGVFDIERALINGNVGVSLFFTLSGFLLSIPFWRAKTGVARQPAIDAYWVHRTGVLPVPDRPARVQRRAVRCR